MRKIKLFKPYISWQAVWNVLRMLRSGQLAEGPLVKKFEQALEDKFGLKNVVTVNSGTAALELAYDLAGIKSGDEVISTVLTCTATNIPLARRGAKIVFADIDKDLNISVEDVKRKITTNTKAIVFVHFGGNNRGLKELLQIAEEKGLKLIEDAAQAIASNFWGKADYTAVSLQAIKTLTTGDGGFLVTKSDEDYKRAKRLRWFGYDREEKQKKGDTDLMEAGYKFHMNDIAAAIGLGNLAVWGKIKKHTRDLMDEYEKGGLMAHPWFALAITEKRDDMKKFLAENGVESGMHHYRNDQYSIFGGRQQFPVMDELENKYLLLPLHMGVRVEDAKRVCNLVKQFNEIH